MIEAHTDGDEYVGVSVGSIGDFVMLDIGDRRYTFTPEVAALVADGLALATHAILAHDPERTVN